MTMKSFAQPDPNPPPLIKVTTDISQPDDLYRVYFSKVGYSWLFMTFLSVGSCCFELFLPALVGLLIIATN